ncbi:phage tail length tape measure family protein [Marinomonas spartinae]|uniref:phage tail length tape measure family protein n=1 Tax=Marinomonas spartinae TaxID=1792290 RepID=UPI0018F1E4BD|nr:phage tail length tape measure family protein [Marinomonas spartinae]MBJ7555386.1 hypothetical protein [Marinomonas spartinae]
MGAAIDKIQAEITLNDNGFLDAIDRVDKRTVKYKKAANDAKVGNEALAGSFRSVAQGIAVVDGPFGGVASRVSSVSSLINGTTLAVVGFGAALAATGVIAAKAISAGQDLEQQLYKQQAILRATGFAAGWNAEQLDQMARQTAFATLASVKDIREAQNVMLTFKSVQKSVFVEAVNLSQDLAVVMGGTAASNAKMLGKALEDPIAGITAMSRAGVSFTQSQKDAIKAMVETGNKAEAQRTILAELQKQVGGTGAGEASGLSGSLDTLGQNFETLYENINKATGASKGFEIVVKGWNEIIARAVDATAEDPIGVKLSKLFQKRLELQHKANDAQNKLMHDQYMEEYAAVTKQMNALEALQKKNAQKGMAEYQKGVETRRQLEQQAADNIRKAKEAAGAKSLATIDTQLASEQEKITNAYVKRRAEVDSLVLSEEEVKKRGYKSLAALRLGYQVKLDDQYQKELNALNEKLSKEQQAKDAAEQRDKERLARQKERSLAYFSKIDDQYAQSFLSKEAYENRDYQKTLDKMASERQALVDQNAWSAADQASYDKTAENAKSLHEKKLTDIQKAEHQERIDAQRDFANIFVGMADSKNKELAAIGKAAAIYNIGISTAEGVMDAWATSMQLGPIAGPIVGGILSAALIGYGAEQMANVKSQKYHTGGIAGQASDNFGAMLKSGEINATLMRGEEILTTDDPRHRNNLVGDVYESSSLNSSSSNVLSVGDIYIKIDAAGSQDPNALAQVVGQQINATLNRFVNSSSFRNATVGAVSKYAKQNSGRIPGVRV